MNKLILHINVSDAERLGYTNNKIELRNMGFLERAIGKPYDAIYLNPGPHSQEIVEAVEDNLRQPRGTFSGYRALSTKHKGHKVILVSKDV